MTSRTRLERFRQEAAALARLSWPMVVTNLSYLSMRFTDTVFAGRLSAADLAGVSVGGDLWVPVFLFIMGVLLAVSPTVAHHYGAGNQQAIGHTVRQAFWLALLFSLPGIWVLAQGEIILTAIGVDPAIIPLAAGYLDAVLWGLPALALYYVLRLASEAISHTRPLLYVAAVGVLLNIFADWVLMYGKLGFPALGAVGTGYATAIVQWAMFLGMLWYVKVSPVYRPFALFARIEWPQPKLLLELILLGLPIAVSVFMEGSLFSAVGLLVATLGKTIVAGHTIAINWTALMFMVPMGVAAGITVRVGQALGRGQPETARFAGITGLIVCTGFMAVSATFLWLFPEPIVGLYTKDAAVRSVALSLLLVAVAFQVFDGLQVAAAGVLRGYKDTRVPMLYTVVAYWGLGFPAAWWLGIHQGRGAQAVWMGLIIGLLVAGILMTARFLRRARQPGYGNPALPTQSD